MKNETKEKRLLYFKELYESAKAYHTEFFCKLDKHMRQYLGSDEIDGSEERAGAVRNITYEIIESELSADVPLPKTNAARYSEKSEVCARLIERLCSAVRDRLPFEEMNDLDERYTYIYGGSIFYVEWDSERRLYNENGGVRVHCISPLDFIPQPGIYNIEDMEYCFLKFTTTRSELVTKYAVSPSDTSLADCDYEYQGADTLYDTVSLIVVFYRGENGEIGRFVFSGDLTLSDIPDYYKRKIIICRNCKKEARLCHCENPSIETQNLDFEQIMTETGEIEVPYYTPRRFPIVIRKNTIGNPSHLGGSDCERIRPQQQAINKVETRILQKLLRAGVTPVMPEGTSVSLGNAIFGQVIKMRPGESLDRYGKIDTTPDISQDIAEADRLYDQAKRVLGISDALQGTDNLSAESGYARQLKISQASSRLESKRRMKYLAYSEIYRLIFEHYLAFADEPRILSYKDNFGKIHMSEFNRFDFIESDGADGYKYEDGYLFSVDLNAGSEYSREALWERNLANLESGTLGDKGNPLTLLRYWQAQERAHYPYARENVEFFKSLTESESNSQKSNESEFINET